MLSNYLGRKVAIVVGLMLSTSLVHGQFPTGQHPDRDAYKTLQNYLHKTFDDTGTRTSSVVQTAFGQPTQTKIAPTRTPVPAFGAPGISSGGCAGGEFVGSGGIPAYTGPATTYNSAPMAGGSVEYAPPSAGTGEYVGVVESAPAVSPLAAGPMVGGAAGEVPTFGFGAADFGGYGDYGGGYGMGPCVDEVPIQVAPSPRGGGCCRFSLGVDYLSWWVKGQKLPELVSTSPLGTSLDRAGRKFWPTTTVLFGGDRQENENVSGIRVRGSWALDCCCCNRIGFEYFNLGTNDFSFSKQTPGDYDILARPFYNPWTGNEDAEFVGYPGLIDGRVDVRGSTDFDGFGVWWRHNLLCCQGGRGGCGGGGLFGGRGGCGGGCGGAPTCGPSCGPSCGSGGGCGSLFGGGGGCGGGPLVNYGCAPRRRSMRLSRLDLIAGYRHLNLDESVTIREYLTVTDPAGPVPYGTTFDIFDSFRAQNEFDGFDFGLGWQWCCGKFGVNALTKVAFGQVTRKVQIDGFTDITTPVDGLRNYSGGLLALPSNMGSYEDTDFTVIPEVGLNLSYQLSCKLRFNFGYTMIFFPEVVRPGGTIDLDVDPRQLPPPTVVDSDRPEFKDYLDDFWAQGFNVGLEYCF